MSRCLPVVLLAAWFTAGAETGGQPSQSAPPEFRPSPEVPAMPKALMKLPRTPLAKARFPVVDFHFHGRELRTAEAYQKTIELMDQTGVGVIANMDGGFGADFDRHMKLGEPFKDRIVQFARLDFDGISQPGWAARTAAELERNFLAGAAGLKINKVLGLDLKNPDGTYIQADDPRFDAVWDMCAKHGRPVMIHISDSYGRFLPIGPENERYEAGLWRSSPEGNYHMTGQPGPDIIEKAREHMHAKHPKTRFVNAHMAMLYYDMDKVAALLDRYPNADVEISAAVQDLGRAPLLVRKFFLKYQDRILFGSDGNPGRGAEEFWQPHWRFLETYDEHFDHPAQIRSATGAPLHGRWRISGIGLPDAVLRKVYYANALRYLPSARASHARQLAARTAYARLPDAVHLRDLGGTLRSFLKRDLAGMTLPRESTMPATTALSTTEAQNLVASLISLRPARPVQGAPEVWLFDRLDDIGGHRTTVLGQPLVIESPVGKAVLFDGVDDALDIDTHPLTGAETFTWEAVFRPDGGATEQRWFHLSERDPSTGLDTDNRMLFEIRVAGGHWFLDSFNQSGSESKALMNRTALHPLGEWYHVASVYDGKEFRNYVNGVQEGSADIHLAPHGRGHTSVGMRINRVFYFKGAVHMARFTRRALAPAEFLRPPAKP